jgi:class 3 adenylate cyclase
VYIETVVINMTEVRDTLHPMLSELAHELTEHRWAAEILDSGWRPVWVSEELKALFPSEHRANFFDLSSNVTAESRERWVRTNVPYVLGSGEITCAQIANTLGPDLGNLIGKLGPQSPPARWFSFVDLLGGQLSGRISYSGEPIVDQLGACIGYVMRYIPALPANLLNILVRGDRQMHERMVSLVAPAPRSAAILFVDIEGSGTLSRQLSSATYFRLISALRAGFEVMIGRARGVMGKHAGDGATALFLSEQLGSESAAARAAIEAARGFGRIVDSTMEEIVSDSLPIDRAECLLKVGLHWGGTLYLGQISTQSRLEITALGDEMNEAARIEQSAQGGHILVSKALIERLRPADSAALSLDSDRIRYSLLGNLDNVPTKAVRDAGSIAVATLDLQLDSDADPAPVGSQ